MAGKAAKIEVNLEAPPKRGRGRPRKPQPLNPPPKRPRGRPRKVPVAVPPPTDVVTEQLPPKRESNKLADPKRRIEILSHALAGEAANVDEQLEAILRGLKLEIALRTTRLHASLRTFLRQAVSHPIQRAIKIAEALEKVTDGLHRLRRSGEAPLVPLARLEKRLARLEKRLQKLDS